MPTDHPLPAAVEAAATAVDNAMDALLEAVQSELAKAANEEGITKMAFGLGSSFFRGRKEVPCPRLQSIEDAYLRYHRGGFLAHWTKRGGWK